MKFNVAAFLRTFLSSANEWAEDKVHIRIGFNEKVNLKRSFNPHSFVNLYHTCFLSCFFFVLIAKFTLYYLNV